ncbi:hypothetical protein OHA72_48180 [Dactylosporangium sp. NBC_01737]|uniref:hypothetical protein n=1 Tax=Dactylosporangium sp. NBC_01737 TaxID=2975959 RepID=UPI002E164E7E|nr:hypothetical protein OHA72_48180 [Dactylosporangium sp. NBC_01737]
MAGTQRLAQQQAHAGRQQPRQHQRPGQRAERGRARRQCRTAFGVHAALVQRDEGGGRGGHDGALQDQAAQVPGAGGEPAGGAVRRHRPVAGGESGGAHAEDRRDGGRGEDHGRDPGPGDGGNDRPREAQPGRGGHDRRHGGLDQQFGAEDRQRDTEAPGEDQRRGPPTDQQVGDEHQHQNRNGDDTDEHHRHLYRRGIDVRGDVPEHGIELRVPRRLGAERTGRGGAGLQSDRGRADRPRVLQGERLGARRERHGGPHVVRFEGEAGVGQRFA